MNAKELLNEIFNTRRVEDGDGNMIDLHSSLDQREGEFLSKIIRENNIETSIEVGCACGISSLYICDALKNSPKRHHTILDPFQSSTFKNVGVTNLHKAGIDYYELLEHRSELALPELLAAGRQFDFGFIDGWHTFDHTLLDFFYMNRLVKVGGIIAIDDVGFPSINKAMRYILNYPGYELIGQVDVRFSQKRELFDSLARSPFRLLSRLMPQRFAMEIFSGKTLHSDRRLKLNATMVALRKTKEDERGWAWYKEF